MTGHLVRNENLKVQEDILDMARNSIAEARSLLKTVIELRSDLGEVSYGMGALSDIVCYLGEFAEEVRMIMERTPKE